MRIIRFDDLAEIPWRNGGGITREIAEERDAGDLIWRLSMADVGADGPFSDFTGLTRILTVIAGAGLRLHTPGGVIEAGQGVPVGFDGGDRVSATLIGGPVRDLNLMMDPTCCTGTVEALSGPLEAEYPARPGGLWSVHCLGGAVRVGDGEILGPGDTALADEAPLRLEMADGASALLIAVRDLPEG